MLSRSDLSHAYLSSATHSAAASKQRLWTAHNVKHLNGTDRNVLRTLASFQIPNFVQCFQLHLHYVAHEDRANQGSGLAQPHGGLEACDHVFSTHQSSLRPQNGGWDRELNRWRLSSWSWPDQTSKGSRSRRPKVCDARGENPANLSACTFHNPTIDASPSAKDHVLGFSVPKHWFQLVVHLRTPRCCSKLRPVSGGAHSV